MQVPHQTAINLLNIPDLPLALMDVQPLSRSSDHFIRMLGQVSKEFAPIAKTVLKSPKWVEYRVAQQQVKQLKNQVQVSEESLDWKRVLGCLISYKTMPDVVKDLTGIMIGQLGFYGAANSCTKLTRENNLAVIEALMGILAAYPHDYNLNANVLRIVAMLYYLRQNEDVDAADRLKAHMAVAIKILTRSNTETWGLTFTLDVIMAINKVSNTTLRELAGSSNIDLLRLFLEIRLNNHDKHNVTRRCTGLSHILVSIPYVSREPVHTPSPTAADLILGYMKEFPGDQKIHDAECKHLDALLTSHAGAFALAPNNLCFVSDLIQNQQMNMNGPHYNSQEYVLWKLVEASIDIETPANVPENLYHTLQSCFPIDFLLRTLVCHTFAPPPDSQPVQTSELIFRVCKLIRFQTQYVSDSQCFLSSRRRFVEKNGISVFIDVVYQIPKENVSLLNISIMSTCINILSCIFAENEAVLETTLAHSKTCLRHFAYGARKKSRSTITLSSFFIDELINRNVAGKYVCDRMYLRYVRDTVHLVWVLVKYSCYYRELVIYSIRCIADKVCSIFCHWHPSMDANRSCVFQQEDDILCVAQLVWYIDDLVSKVVFDENMNVWWMDGTFEQLEEYMLNTRQYRMMSSKLYYVMHKAQHPSSEIPSAYYEPSLPPTRDGMTYFPS